MRFYIIDDDRASRSMLKAILLEQELGMVIGESDSGAAAIPQVVALSPDVVLIDLLMPDMDGIETVRTLREQGFTGQFIMLSQVVDKEMVGESYMAGIDFFIHKPINRIEVRTIVKRLTEQQKLQESLHIIRESLANIGGGTVGSKPTVRDDTMLVMQDMGIIGEAGVEDIALIVAVLFELGQPSELPPLKELYIAAVLKKGRSKKELPKEVKAMEQRIRRTILTGMEHVASLGAVDYTIAEFEYYAPRFFDFQEITNRMRQLQKESFSVKPMKVNVKKFISVLYKEVTDRQKKYR